MRDWYDIILLGCLAIGLILLKIAVVFGIVFGICWIVKYMFF